MANSVANDTGTTVSLTVGGSRDGLIESADLDGSTPDKDWYKVVLTAGHSYHFTGSGTSGTLNVIAMRVYNSSGSAVSSLADNSAALDFTPTSSGTYYLAVSAGGSNFASKTGAFHVAVADTTPTSSDTVANDTGTGSSLSVGGSRTGTIDAADLDGSTPDKDWYKVILTAGHSYHFTGRGTSGLLDLVAMRVYNSNGSAVSGLADDSDPIDFTATSSGTYYLAVSAGGSNFAGKTGNFSVTLSDTTPTPSDTVDNDTGTGSSLSVGGSRTGTIDAADLDGSTPDKDWYKVSLTAGNSYHFTGQGTSGSLDLVAMRIYNSSGSAVSSLADDSAPIDFTPTSSGTYYLAVSAGGSNFAGKTGNFSLVLSETTSTPSDTVANDVGTSASLSVGGSANGTINTADVDGSTPDKDWYKLSLTAGHGYHFTGQGTSGSLDLVAMRVYDAGGSAVSSLADNSAPLDFTPTSSGVYYLAVSAGGSNFLSKTGNFSLGLVDGGVPATDQVREGTGTLHSLTTAARATSTIEAEPISGNGSILDGQGGFVDKDWFKVTLDPGKIYTFDAMATSITTGNVVISLYETDTLRLRGPVESAAPSFTFDTTGQTGAKVYYLAVSAGGAGSTWQTATGNYSVGVAAGTAPPAGIDSVANDKNTSASISIGGSVTGTINPSDADGSTPDKDWYKVALLGGHTYRFTGSGNSGSLDLIAMRVYNSTPLPPANWPTTALR